MGTLKITNGSISADTFVGDLTGTAKYAQYDSSTGKNLFCRGAAPDSGNLNTMFTAGNYRFSGTTANGPSSIYIGYGQALILQGPTWADTVTQIVFPYNNQNMYFRSGTTTTAPNTDWTTVLTSGNYTTFVSKNFLPLSGGTLTGPIIHSTKSYGSSLPSSGATGQVFYKLV